MNNGLLCRITKQRKWSDIIRQRRISWLGHLIRLGDETPAKKALNHIMSPMIRTRGRPKLDWFRMIKLQLTRDFGLSFAEAQEVASDRKAWRALYSVYAKR